MDEPERERLLALLNSVEKEDALEESVAERDREMLRRQIFPDNQADGAVEDEFVIEREGSDQSDDSVHHSEHNTDSERSSGESEEVEEEGLEIEDTPNQNYLLGKDNQTQWNVHMDTSNLRGRVRRQNIIRAERIGVRLPSPKGIGLNVKSPYESWKLFFPDSLIEKIVEYTNIWIAKNKGQFTRERDAKETDHIEINAVLGLLFLAGVLRSSHTRLEDLWANDGLGIEYFRSTMSIKRFKFLLRAIRFDDIRTRRQRKATDKLAPIRSVFDDFVQRCQEYYSVSAYITVDEMLEGFRGRCSFRQYIPNKPARYGIKMFAMCDARTFYTSNIEVYVGKQPPGPYNVSNTAKDIAIRMITPVSGTGRHLTVDNWYGSIQLAKELLNEHRITLVSTLRKNKKEIPLLFNDPKGRTPCSSLFAYQKDCTLLSYVPRRNKVVLLVSTFHHTDEIDPDSGDKSKPYLLTCYNKNKGGVDTVDQMKSAYTVARRSNRWPLTIFFSLMNISGINSFIILRSNDPTVVDTRRSFLRTLAKDLCKENMVRRSSIPTLPRQLRERIMQLSGRPIQAPPENEDGHLPATGRCYLCDRSKNRKSRTRCPRCHLFVCREHTRSTCTQCAGARHGQGDSSSDGED